MRFHYTAAAVIVAAVLFAPRGVLAQGTWSATDITGTVLSNYLTPDDVEAGDKGSSRNLTTQTGYVWANVYGSAESNATADEIVIFSRTYTYTPMPGEQPPYRGTSKVYNGNITGSGPTSQLHRGSAASSTEKPALAANTDVDGTYNHSDTLRVAVNSGDTLSSKITAHSQNFFGDFEYWSAAAQVQIGP